MIELKKKTALLKVKHSILKRLFVLLAIKRYFLVKCGVLGSGLHPTPTPPHMYLLLRRGNKKQWIALLSNYSFHRSTFHKHCWPYNCLLHFLAGEGGGCMPWHTCRGQRTSSGVSSLNPPHGPQPWGQASLSTETSHQPTVYPVIFCSVCILLFPPFLTLARHNWSKPLVWRCHCVSAPLLFLSSPGPQTEMGLS